MSLNSASMPKRSAVSLTQKSDLGSYSRFEYTVGFGKRFRIAENVLWKPEIGLTGIGSARPNFQIIPAQISFRF